MGMVQWQITDTIRAIRKLCHVRLAGGISRRDHERIVQEMTEAQLSLGIGAATEEPATHQTREVAA